MSDATGDGPLSALPDEVVQRILQELPTRGQKVISCILTAAELINHAVGDERSLRYAESIGYNLREALEAVVANQPPAGDALPTVIRAWEHYREQASGSEDGQAALQDLEQALEQLSAKRERSSYHAARLLAYLRSRTGVDPLAGEQDPIVQYSRLRKAANDALHTKATLEGAAALYDRTVAWFIRMFTPPDTVVRELDLLAVERWSRPEQIERLRTLATNPHHLRLFLGRLTDPNWLGPLYQARILEMPQADVPWPVVALLDGLAQTVPGSVAALMEHMLRDSRREPKDRQLGIVFELLRMAAQLGDAGHTVVAGIPRHHYRHQAVRSLAVSVARKAPAGDAIVMHVVDAALDDLQSDNDRHHLDTILVQVVEGLDSANVVDRIQKVAVKVRAAVNAPNSRFIALARAALTAELGNERRPLAVLLHHFARMLVRARELGVSTSDLLHWVEEIGGEAGDRLTSRIFAEANDVSVRERAAHVVARLASTSVTGDDRDLVVAIMRLDPGQEVRNMWTAALGTPSELVAESRGFPDDWARAWRWSMVLPKEVLGPWQEPIASVSARYGPPDSTVLDLRPDYELLGSQSPYDEAEMATLPALEAAEKVGNWRPDVASDRRMIGARELARTLETVVKADPGAWALEPTEIVKALREPVHVLHYFSALRAEAKAVAHASQAILSAAAFVREARWEPVVLGDDDFDFEPGWDNVDTAIVELAAALGNADGDLRSHLDAVWTWILELLDQDQAEEADVNGSNSWDMLHEAINNSRGRSFQSALALAGWEFRNLGEIGPRFFRLLDDFVALPGQAGREYRAVLAQHRIFLERVALEWLEGNATVLFRDGTAGVEAFELTLKYARPTPWFLSRFRDELFTAARNKAENAVNWLLIGALWQEAGYELDVIVTRLKSDVTALATSCGAMPHLVRDLDAGSAELGIAVEYWRTVLKMKPVPFEALASAGGWAFVASLEDETWSGLVRETLELTGGHITFLIEVADRCATACVPSESPKVFLLLLGKGEPWEQSHVAGKAIEVLTALAKKTVNDDVRLLRTRLIDLGYHRAIEIDLGDG